MTADRLVAERYRLTDPIGTGAMGVVWRATDVRLRRTVAVKQLLLGPGLTPAAALEAKMRAMREGRIAARLHHPNAVTVFDVAEEDGQPWLVMEYVAAPSLAALLRERGPLDPIEVARVGAEVAAALAAAHDAGIVHRDVKPANILVADNGTVKITDFGISRAVGDVTVTSTGFLAGTPAYLSPEVARGENPDPASDVFALGSTLYAAVEGSPPFGEGDNPLAVLHAVARAHVPPAVRAGALEPVLMNLLAADIADRPSMRGAQTALEAVAEGRAIARTATKVLPKDMVAEAVVASAPSALPVASAVLDGPVTDATVSVSSADPHIDRAFAPTVSPAVPQADTAVNGPDESRNRRTLVLAALGIVGVLLIAGMIVAATYRSGGGGSMAAPGVSVPAPSVSGSASEDIGPAVGNPQPLAATSSTTMAPTPSNISRFISDYYGMLPGNINGAWSLLSPSYQARTGGYNQYTAFWSSFGAVNVSGVEHNGDTTVATVTYVYKNGSSESERRWFRVAPDGDRLIIVDSQRA